ncbi:hypothetical protein RA280_26800 [Cupriavidus sp. CV2]|uniref:hypothetical protein n=1 Tax=Cupriavidus ulmosensis TaxID=3065913 RepID=UPI00296ABA68|nr:hypothetical protein [Cupriavidus sp. CV2]MDW3685289.1 hypothetical protein [Cupriavidus sp. CV2]
MASKRLYRQTHKRFAHISPSGKSAMRSMSDSLLDRQLIAWAGMADGMSHAQGVVSAQRRSID